MTDSNVSPLDSQNSGNSPVTSPPEQGNAATMAYILENMRDLGYDTDGEELDKTAEKTPTEESCEPLWIQPKIDEDSLNSHPKLEMDSDYCMIEAAYTTLEPPVPDHILEVINMLVHSMANDLDTEEMEILRWQLRSLVTDKEKDKATNSFPDPDIREQVELPLRNAIYINELKKESNLSQYKSFCNLHIRRIVRNMTNILRRKDKVVPEAEKDVDSMEYEFLSPLKESPTAETAEAEKKEMTHPSTEPIEEWPDIERTPSLEEISQQARKQASSYPKTPPNPLLQVAPNKPQKQLQYSPDVKFASSDVNDDSLDFDNYDENEEDEIRKSDERYPTIEELLKCEQEDAEELGELHYYGTFEMDRTQGKYFEPSAAVDLEKSDSDDQIQSEKQKENGEVFENEEASDPGLAVLESTEERKMPGRRKRSKQTRILHENSFEEVSEDKPTTVVSSGQVKIIRRKVREEEKLRRQMAKKEFVVCQADGNHRTCATRTDLMDDPVLSGSDFCQMAGTKLHFRAEVFTKDKVFWIAECMNTKEKSVMICPFIDWPLVGGRLPMIHSTLKSNSKEDPEKVPSTESNRDSTHSSKDFKTYSPVTDVKAEGAETIAVRTSALCAREDPSL